MQAHYGYIKRSDGADGDEVDVFICPSTDEAWAGKAYVIDQVDAGGAFDEHKVMLGYDDESSAVRAYLAQLPERLDARPRHADEHRRAQGLAR